jgi:hypothetical protein
MVRVGAWSGEDDPEGRLFDTPREAADFAFANPWKEPE